MADKIRLLPEVVANQIAAGEVVNRPASVVKEMMENAIDAGARTVKVNFRDGGKDLIQIVDDGCGMVAHRRAHGFRPPRHEQDNSVDDIYALNTFGFRGEALASIGRRGAGRNCGRGRRATKSARRPRSTAASSPDRPR